MLFYGIKNIWFRSGVFLVFTSWAALMIYRMYQNYYIWNPPPASPPIGTAAYGTNSVGDFGFYAIMLLNEYLIVMAVLLLFSFSRHYWARVLILQAVFGFWLILLFAGAMHSGGVYVTHFFAVFLLNVLIFVLLLLSIGAAIYHSVKMKNSYGNENNG